MRASKILTPHSPVALFTIEDHKLQMLLIRRGGGIYHVVCVSNGTAARVGKEYYRVFARILEI